MQPFVARLRSGRWIGTVALLAAVYFIAAKLGLRLAFVNPSATPVWPPTGITLASLLILGYRVWPGIFLGAFLANLTTNGTVWTSLGIASGNTLEGLVGAYLVNTYARGSNAFDRPQDIFKFAVLAATASTMVSPTIGVTTLALAGFARWADFRPIWLTWWLGDATGALIAAPLLILWSKHPRLHWNGREVLERGLFLLALLFVSWVVFGGVFAFAYLTVPFLVWAGFRFGQRDTAAIIAVLAVIAIWGTVKGLGPFVGATPNASLLLLQTFMGIMVMVALPLASVVADRTRVATDNVRRMASERLARDAAEGAGLRLARLLALTSALSEAVSRAQVVDVIVNQGIPALGARAGFVSVLTENGDALHLLGHVGFSEEVVSTVRRVPLSAPRAITEVLETGTPLFIASDAAAPAGDPDAWTISHDGAWAVIPLSPAGIRNGVLALGFGEPREFDHHDQNFMLTLAGQCAQALERAQLYEREHHVSKTLQQAFLPAALPDVPGVKIDAAYLPGTSEAEVGGDWYDVFRLSDGRIACSVGDAVGSGLHAAMIMGQVRQSIRATALEGNDPSAVLDRAGKVLSLAYESPGMATAVFGILDPVALTFAYTTAGHPPPVLATPDQEARALTAGGLPLGLGDSMLPAVQTVSLLSGALLTLYTDGLIQSTRQVAEGEARLLAAVRTELKTRSPSPARAILDHVVGAGDAHDDVAVLTISIALDRIEELSLTLPTEPPSLRQVRQALRQLGLALHLNEETAYVVQVVLGEAVNNAVEHAYGAGSGTFHLRVWREADLLKMEVSDQGRWRPERPEDPGHGLKIMQDLADTMDVDRQPSGTTVRLAVRLGHAPAGPMSVFSPLPEQNRTRDAGREAGQVGHAEVHMNASPLSREGRCEIRQVAGIPVVDVSGEVDISNARAFEETLERAARLDQRAVVVSLANTSFFDSKVIHSLFRFGQRLATNRQRLLLVISRERPAHRIVEITGLSEAFPVFDAVDDAIAAVTGGA